MLDIIAKNFSDNAQPRIFLDGSKRAVIVLRTMTIGRGEYLPGWQWSKHAKPQTGKSSQAHIGFVLSGQMAVKAAAGTQIIVGPNQGFEADPGHDAWVVGNEPCVALDFEYLKLKINR